MKLSARRPRRRTERGTIISYFLILVSLVTTGMLMTVSLTAGVETQVAGITLERDQAFYAAEAGLQRGLWYYRQNSAWRAPSTSPLVGTLSNGNTQYTYSVTCVDAGANTIKLVSTVQTPTSPAASQVSASITGGGAAPGLAIGNNLSDSGTLNLTGSIQAKGNVTRTGTMNLFNIAGNAPSSLQAMGFFNSSGTFILPGDLLLNSTITSSNVVTVGGNAQAGGAISHSGNNWTVAGTTNAYDNPNLVINTPTVDTATLIAEATADGTVIAGGNKSNYTIDFTHGANHVVCVSGNLALSGTTTIIGSGTLIVQGTLNSSSNIGTAASPVQMNLVTTSDAALSGTKNYINGAVCVGGTFTKSGQANITGVVVVQSDLVGSGSITITYAAPPSFVHYTGAGGNGVSASVGNFTGPIY